MWWQRDILACDIGPSKDASAAKYMRYIVHLLLVRNNHLDDS
jgi:hypothetical protein